MGKEKKIGLAVILILLMGLGVAVVKRLTGSKEEPQASVVEQTSPRSDEAKNDSAEKQARWAAHAQKAALVAPKASSSGAANSSLADLSQLSVVSGEDNAKHHPAHESRSASAGSNMPDPPREQTAKPKDRYASEHSSPPTQPPWPDARVARSDSADATAADDPFRHHAGQRDAMGAEEHLASQRYEARGTETQQMPPYGQTSRYDNSTPPPAPQAVNPYPPRDQRPSETSSHGADGGGSPNGSQRAAYLRSQQVLAHGGARFGGASGRSWGSKEGLREDGTYEIQPNDNYWIISEKLYGTGAYFKALAHHNRKKIPQEDQLPVGETIAAPNVAQLEKAFPDLCPKPSHREADKRRGSTVGMPSQRGTGRVYVVQEGDTLFDIARNELGKASRWAEIYELNRDQLGPDYNYLPHGLQLMMPGSDTDANIPRRASANSLYSR